MQRLFSLRKKEKHLATAIGLIGAIWLLSAGPIYLMMPALGVPSSYHLFPYVFGAYFLCWIAAVLLFVLPRFPQYLEIRITQHGLGIICLNVAIVFLYYHLIFPLLISFSGTVENAYNINGNFLSGSSHYVFVKALEIAFQQIMIVMLIMSFKKYKNDFWFVALATSTVFALAHVITIFVDGPVLTLVFILGSFVLGFLFTAIQFKFKDAFSVSYMLHWGVYLILVTLITTVCLGCE